MPASMPLLLVPGLTCTARLYTPQVEALWPFAPVTIPDHRQDDHIDAVARRILADAPPRFALAGLSMGGYIAFAMMRLAPERIARPDSRPMLGGIRCPTLVLVGDADVATPPELSREIAAGIAGAKLVVVPNCAHLSTLEQPEAVNAALIDWLAKG